MTDRALDDLELFASVQAREPAAWAAFVDRFGPLILAAVRRTGCTGGEEEEVVQATWQRLFTHAPKIAAPRALPAWVLRVATREAWLVVRRRRSSHDVDARVGAERAFATDRAVDEQLAALEQVQLVRDAVAALGGRCTPLLTALFLEADAPDYGALAARFGMPIGSIGPSRQRCLGKLAAALERAGLTAADLDEPRISG